jgi:hypothetical protein
MKMLLLRAAVPARRRKRLAESTRRTYQRRLDHALNAIMMLAPVNSHGKRLRKRYGKERNSWFTCLEHPEAPPDNNGSERELRPTATYRKVTVGSAQTGAPIFSLPFDRSLAPQHDADSMRIRRFALSWRGNLSFNRVEQIHHFRSGSLGVPKIAKNGPTSQTSVSRSRQARVTTWLLNARLGL